MDYKERIKALKAFKESVSSGETTDTVSGVSSEVSGWTGDARGKFDSYIETVKSDCKGIAGRKSSFLSDIDTIINNIQALFDLEYQTHSYILLATFDAKSSSKNRSKKIQAINNMLIDNSVKKALKAKL